MSAQADDVYVLDWEVSHLGDEDSDATPVKFPGSDQLVGLIPRPGVKLPEKLLLVANFKTLDQTDFPYVNRWPIMSDRMLATIKSAGDFPHQEIPVIMLDDTIDSKDRIDASGAPKPSASRGGFVGVSVPLQEGIFDKQNSKFDPDPVFPDEPQVIHKLALKKPAGGYPSLFRLFEYPSALLIPAPVQAKLQAAGIRGATYTPASQYKTGKQ